MLSIDEAIAECKENDLCQLAEWLEELKEYKQNPEGWMWDEAERKGYNKAIDDFATDIINKINFEDKWLFECKSNNADTNIVFSALRTFINERAEQLKAGGR